MSDTSHETVFGLAAPPWILGHRGAGGEAPENTLESLSLAAEQGADMVEIDLQLTSDGSLVACHDWDLERMGDSGLIVEQTDLDTLKEVDVSGPFRQPDRRHALPTLAEVLALLPPGLPLNLELKRRSADTIDLAGAVTGAIAGRGRLLISSFDWSLLTEVRRLLPRAPLAPLGGRSSDPAELLAAARELDAWSVHCRSSLASPELVRDAEPRPVLAYTVNEPATARRLFEGGVRGVFSDHPGRLRRQLEVAP
jgi:glycerophosphoryl diester phosphodiesterase